MGRGTIAPTGKILTTSTARDFVKEHSADPRWATDKRQQELAVTDLTQCEHRINGNGLSGLEQKTVVISTRRTPRRTIEKVRFPTHAPTREGKCTRMTARDGKKTTVINLSQ